LNDYPPFLFVIVIM